VSVILRRIEIGVMLVSVDNTDGESDDDGETNGSSEGESGSNALSGSWDGE
jgi:hypothetical protein